MTKIFKPYQIGKALNKQQGVAAIMAVFMMVPIAASVQFALEGTRLIQEQNRLADATEAATLAVSIADRGTGSISDTLAKGYIESYIRDMDQLATLNVVRSEGQEDINGERAYFVQYEVDATATYDTWFESSISQNLGGEQNVGNNAIAKTYQLPSDLDLVFIADFSGSMNTNWGSGKSRLDVLKEQVNIISSDLLSSSATNAGYAHRIGLVPYNMRTQERIGGEMRCVTQLNYNVYAPYNIDYASIDWYQWSKYSTSQLNSCVDGGTCPSFSNQYEAKAISNVLTHSRNETSYSSNWPDPLTYVDINSTATFWSDSKLTNTSLHPSASRNDMNLFASGMCDENFTTIPLQREIPNISSMNAGGGTAAYQGVIRGAQILLDGKPSDEQGDEIEDYFDRSQMLLILSDGREDPFTHTFSQLVDAGLCQNIREKFQEHKSPLYIGVIGIAFNAEGQTAFQNCADEVIDVDNSSELLEKIQELIKKGAETNGVSRLYDKNS